jgi:hypothetical protein
VINDSEGVLYAEISALDNSGSYRTIGISDSTNSNRFFIEFSDTTGYIAYNFIVGGVSQSSFQTSITALSNTKIALKYKANDFALWINGTEVSTDTSGSTPTGLNTLSFNDVSLYPFYGNVQNLMVFPSALTDDELSDLTGAVHQTFNSLATFYNYTIL